MNDNVILHAIQGTNRKLTVSATRGEIGECNLRLAYSALRAEPHRFCVGAPDRLVTSPQGDIYISDDDLCPVVLLTRDTAIASLIDAGNTLIHGQPLRPIAFRETEAAS